MDELMDKNLPYFVGGNLATLVPTRKCFSTPAHDVNTFFRLDLVYGRV